MELETQYVSNVIILRLEGRFDSYTVPPIRDLLQKATLREPANIVVNLEKINFIDSTALSTLVASMKWARQQGGDLRLCNLQQPVRMIFELTRLDRAFEILAGEKEAVQAFHM